MKKSPSMLWSYGIAVAIGAASLLYPISARSQSIADPIDIHQQSLALSPSTTPAPGTVVSLTPQFPQRIIDAVDLVQIGKYGEAIDIANELCTEAPNSTVAHQLRGTLELWIGDAGRARKDFELANSVSQDDSVTHFAMALCAMRSTNSAIEVSTVPSELHRASTCPDITAAERADLA